MFFLSFYLFLIFKAFGVIIYSSRPANTKPLPQESSMDVVPPVGMFFVIINNINYVINYLLYYSGERD